MKVLIVSQHFPPEHSGNASRIHDMAFYLAKLGVETTVISPFPTFPAGTYPRVWKRISHRQVDGIESVNIWAWQPVSTDPGFYSRMAYYLTFPLHAALWSMWNRSRFDVIITSAPPIFTHIPGYILKKLLGKTWIIEVRDLWIDASVSLGFIKKGSLFERTARSFDRHCLKNADCIGVTTHELGVRLTNDAEVSKKIVWLPNGVDIRRYRPSDDVKADQIIYAGNIGHAQDLEIVIRSLKEVNKKHHLVLNLVGAGDNLENLHKVVAEEGVSEYVVFTGIVPRDEIPALLSHAKLGISPLKDLDTLEYAAPTKVYEYLACGIPFVGCGKGEIANIARDSGGGIIADNTPDAITNAVISLLDDPGRMHEMGIWGRAYVEKNYDRKMIASRLCQTIEEIKCKKT